MTRDELERSIWLRLPRATPGFVADLLADIDAYVVTESGLIAERRAQLAEAVRRRRPAREPRSWRDSGVRRRRTEAAAVHWAEAPGVAACHPRPATAAVISRTTDDPAAVTCCRCLATTAYGAATMGLAS